jgi:hypothetical protein
LGEKISRYADKAHEDIAGKLEELGELMIEAGELL